MDNNQNPQEKIRFNNIRKSIIQKIVDVCLKYADSSPEELVRKAELESMGLFEKFHFPSVGAGDVPTEKPRKKRMGKNDRKDHVGRFFLYLLEKELKEAKVEHCFITVFANSVHSLIGEELYEKFAQKINHLLDFASQKGFTYEQALESKPGKEIMKDILGLYKHEMESSSKFGDRLKNRLETALIDNFTNEEKAEFNIDKIVQDTFKSFIKIIGL